MKKIFSFIVAALFCASMFAETLPTVALAGVFNNWSTTANVLTPDEGNLTASITVHFEAGYHKFKIVDNGNWVIAAEASGNYQVLRNTASTPNVTTISNVNKTGTTDNFELVADAEGDYIFTWTYETKQLEVRFPDEAVISLEDGYYLVGINGWLIANVDANHKFVPKEDVNRPGQYVLEKVDLALNDEFKVVEVVNNAFKDGGIWYGAGEGNNNYKVTENYVGTKDIYFNTTWQNDWNGYVYVKPNSTVDIENAKEGAKAVKVLRNGMLFIEKNGKTCNLLSTIVR